MPYVQRDEQNNICGIFANKQSYAEEYLEDDHPEVVTHLNPVKIPDPVAIFLDDLRSNPDKLNKLKAAADTTDKVKL